MITYRIDKALSILSQMDRVMLDAPRELTIYPVVLPAPPLPGLPRQMIGTAVLILIVVYTGEPSKYEDAMVGVRLLAQPVADNVRPSCWLEANAMLDVLAPPGRRQHSRGGYLAGITPEVATLAVSWVLNPPAPTGLGPSVAVAFPRLGGANLDFPEDSKACSRVGANWMWEVLGQWDGAGMDPVYNNWVDSLMHAMEEHSLRNGYINLSVDRGAKWLQNVYGSREKWDRICVLKATFDRYNRLPYNKNITRARDSH